MKNLLKVFAVAVAVVLAACSKDAVEAPAVTADEAQVTFTTTIPGATEGRAIADGSTVDKLYYAVYEHGQTTKLIDGTETISGKTATVNVTLVSGMKYDIVFWAQKEGAPYTFNTTNNCIDINWTNLVGNNEARDAFIFVRKALEVNGSIQETITLKRPFAQLNIGISDFEAAKKAGFELAETKVSVDSYNQINFFGGEAYSKADGTGDYGMPAGTETPVTFACAAPMTGADETITIKGTAYKYVSMNYILPAMPTDAYDVDITFCTANEVKQYSVPTFAGVTFERNHRTNIMGSLLTDPGKFVIEIDETFDEPAHIVEEIHMVYDESKSAEANGASLYEAIKNAGNDAVIYLSPGIYMGTDGMTARYTNSNNITIIGVGEGVILAGAKYGRVFDCENPAGATFTLKNVTLKTDHEWAAAVYAKNYATVNLYDVKTVNAGTTAILLDACNMINGVHPGDQKTYVNAYGVTIEAGDLVELNANPCNAYPTASPTEAHFTFDNACTNINIVQPQSVCINQGNNLFVNGVAIPVGYMYKNGAMVPTATSVSTSSELAQAFAEGGKIEFAQNIELTESLEIPADKTVELDLNGFTMEHLAVTTNHVYGLKNYGTLTITDTSAEQNGAINSRGIYNYGSLTLESGKIAAIDGNGGYAVNNEPGATFVMNGGWLAADNEDGDEPTPGNYDATALDVPAGATATLNGGKITNAGNYTFAISVNGGNLTIPATATFEIIGRHGAIAVSAGTATINTGTFSVPANTQYTDNVVYCEGSGKITINGGTFTADNDAANGGSCVCDVAGGVTINGGTFGNSSGGDVWGTTGGTVINGGTFADLRETQHISAGKSLVDNGDGTATVR